MTTRITPSWRPYWVSNNLERVPTDIIQPTVALSGALRVTSCGWSMLLTRYGSGCTRPTASAEWDIRSLAVVMCRDLDDCVGQRFQRRQRPFVAALAVEVDVDLGVEVGESVAQDVDEPVDALEFDVSQ